MAKKTNKKKTSQDISFNFKPKQFYKEHKNTINKVGVFLLVLIPIILAIYFRAYSADLPMTDTWAEQSVANFYQQQFAEQIRAEFPNLPTAQLEQRVNQEWLDLRESNRAIIDAQIAQTSQQFKSNLQNDAGETYWLGIDSWFYLKNAQNLVEYGHHGNELRDGKPYETQRIAPIGANPDSNWHANVIVLFHKVVSLFSPNISMMGAAFLLPAVFAALATIPAFFIVRRRAGNLGGFVAATLVAIHTAFMSRSMGGFVDTDTYNVFFPLLAIWLFFEAFEAKEWWKKALFALGSGLAVGVFSKFWLGWWYAFLIILATLIAYMLYLVVRFVHAEFFSNKARAEKKSWFESPHWESMKGTLLISGIFYAVTGIVVSTLISAQRFFASHLSFLDFSGRLEAAINTTLWPNVLTTVAELGDITFAGVVGNMGGKGLFFLALMGASMALLPKKTEGVDYWYLSGAALFFLVMVSDRALGMNPYLYLALITLPLLVGLVSIILRKKDVDVKFSGLMLVWFIAAMFTTTQGIRFTLVLVPAFALMIGTFAGITLRLGTKLIEQEFSLPHKYVMPTVAILLLFILVSPMQDAHALANSQVPNMNDAWYDTLVEIREGTPEDTILMSWWDFGHWFRGVADRPVTFDGASQNTPMAHWMGRLLLTQNEDRSVGVMRMLACGSYTGFDVLNEELQDPVRTKLIFSELMVDTPEEARTYLQSEGISEETISRVLPLTHCEEPNMMLITSQDMVSKGSVWGHFGEWDFVRAHIVQNLRSGTEESAVNNLAQYGVSEEEARSLYREARDLRNEQQINAWVAPWPSYAGGLNRCETQTGQINRTTLGMNETPNEPLVDRDLAVCQTNVRLSQGAQGTVVLDAIIIDLEEPSNTRLQYGVYAQNGQRVESGDAGQPAVLYVGYENQTGLTRYNFSGETVGLGITYDSVANRAIVSDVAHAGSLFTQLFFLEGRYNERFEQFSDKTSFTGQRITTWNVNW